MQGQSAEVTGDFSAFSLRPGVPSCSHEPSLVLSLYSQQRICRCVSGALVFLFYLLTTYIKNFFLTLFVYSSVQPLFYDRFLVFLYFSFIFNFMCLSTAQ